MDDRFEDGYAYSELKKNIYIPMDYDEDDEKLFFESTISRFMQTDHLNFIISQDFFRKLQRIGAHFEDEQAVRVFMTLLCEADYQTGYQAFLEHFNDIRGPAGDILAIYHLAPFYFGQINNVHSFDGGERTDEVVAKWKKGIHALIELTFPDIEFDDRYAVLSLEIAAKNLAQLKNRLKDEDPRKEKIETLSTLVAQHKNAEMSSAEENALAKAVKAVIKYVEGGGSVEDYNAAIERAHGLNFPFPWAKLVGSIMLGILALSLFLAAAALIVCLVTPAAPLSAALLASVTYLLSSATAANIAISTAAGVSIVGGAFSTWGSAFFTKKTVDEGYQPTIKKQMEEIGEVQEEYRRTIELRDEPSEAEDPSESWTL